MAGPRREFGGLKGLRNLRGAGLASTIGLTLVIASAIGYLIGDYLDRRFQTKTPWFTVVFFLLGVGAGFLEMIKVLSDISRDE